jgi:hypothetical protein
MNGAVYDLKGMAHYFCNVDVEEIRGTDVTNEVVAMYEGDAFSFPDFCPLVEVKEPHGDFVDKDKLMTEVMDSDLDHLQRDDWKEVIQIVSDADVVIEAEGREE